MENIETLVNHLIFLATKTRKLPWKICCQKFIIDDLFKPNLQTRLNIPGMNYAPKFDPKNEDDSKRLKENDDVDFAWDKNTDNYKFYSDKIDDLKNLYSASKAATPFVWSSLGECAQAPYGFDSTEPCIYLRLNKVSKLIYWKSQYYHYYSLLSPTLAGVLREDS